MDELDLMPIAQVEALYNVKLRPSQNYYGMKAYFAAIELAELDRKLAIAMRRRDFKLADMLLSQHDKLASELNNYEKQAKARLSTI